MKWFQITAMALATLVLTACAANQQRAERDRAHVAAVHAAAGQSVSSISYPVQGLYSWQALNDRELLVYTRPTRAWLLDVGLCPQLTWTTAIGLTTHTGRINTLIDSVMVNDGVVPCTIQKIRSVDVAQLREQVRQRGDAKAVPAPASSVSTP